MHVSLQEVILPPRLEWLGEMGVMVPVLDLANHAPAASATAYFAVDMTRSELALSNMKSHYLVEEIASTVSVG